MRSLLFASALAAILIGSSTAAGIESIPNLKASSHKELEKAVQSSAVAKAEGLYTLNVTSYQYSDCTGKATFYVAKEGECLRTPRGFVRPTPPPSETSKCATIVYCRRDFTIFDDMVCGACNGWTNNRLSHVFDCNFDANTVDVHFYNNLDKAPERCKYNKYDTLNVPANGVCTQVTGLGSLKVTNLYDCSVVGVVFSTIEAECMNTNAAPSLSTITQFVPNGKCVEGIRVYRNKQANATVV